MTEQPASDLSARVPRYTSYPTAAQFTDKVGPEDYAAWLADLRDARRALYLHVPFCASICTYCACHTTATSRPEVLDSYADHLLAEARLLAERMHGDGDFVAWQWGGGTPTHLGAARLRRLVEELAQLFPLTQQSEHAVEIDPRTCDAAIVETLAMAGVGRASLGVQDFDPQVQEAIGRVQSFGSTAATVAALRGSGIAKINLDLVYGLPLQDLASLEETLERALALNPDRLAVFGYAHVPWMKPRQRLIDAETLPDPSLRQEMSLLIEEVMVEAGYTVIGLDHYARPEDSLAIAAAAGRLRRNFQGYSDIPADAVLGLGASAISCLPQGFVQNAAKVAAWRRAIAGGQLATERGVRRDSLDCLRAAVIERLMCDLEVDVAKVAQRLGQSPGCLAQAMEKADALAASGALERDGWTLRVKDRQRGWARLAAACFDPHWQPESARHAPAV